MVTVRTIAHIVPASRWHRDQRFGRQRKAGGPALVELVRCEQLSGVEVHDPAVAGGDPQDAQHPLRAPDLREVALHGAADGR